MCGSWDFPCGSGARRRWNQLPLPHSFHKACGESAFVTVNVRDFSTYYTLDLTILVSACAVCLHDVFSFFEKNIGSLLLPLLSMKSAQKMGKKFLILLHNVSWSCKPTNFGSVNIITGSTNKGESKISIPMHHTPLLKPSAVSNAMSATCATKNSIMNEI